MIYVHIKILDNNKAGKNKIASLNTPPKKSLFDLGSIKILHLVSHPSLNSQHEWLKNSQKIFKEEFVGTLNGNAKGLLIGPSIDV